MNENSVITIPYSVYPYKIHHQLIYMPYIEVNGKNLFYQRCGSGPTILTVHGGLGMDSVHVKYLLQHLENRFEFIYYDQRGHGKSDAINADNFTYSEFVEDIEGLRIALALENFYLMGISAGSYISLMYAEKYGENLKGLIIYSGFHRPDEHANPEEVMQEAGKRMPQQYQNFVNMRDHIEELEPDVPQKLGKEFRLISIFSYYYNFTDDFKEFWKKVIEEGTMNFDILRRDVKLRQDLNIKIENIKTPTLILASKYDITHIRISQEMADLIPKTELHMFEKSGHFPSMEEPEKFEKIFSSWVQ